MHWVQFLVIVAYFLLLVVVGHLSKRFSKSASDFLIAGRNMGLALVTVSVVGQWLGGMSTIGTAEKAYHSGFFPLWYNVSTATGMFLFGLTLAAVYRKHQVHTVGEMIQNLFNKKVRVISSFAFLIAFVVLSYLQLQAIGSLFSQLFGGILSYAGTFLTSLFGGGAAFFTPYNIAIIFSGIFVILYVYEGGMKSIALTNMIHIILLFSTIITVYILVMVKVGGYGNLFATLEKTTAFHEIHRSGVSPGQAVEAGKTLVAQFKNPFSMGLGTVFAWLLGGVLAGFASQASIQPVFAAKDINTAKKGAMMSAFLIAPLGVFVATMGMAVRAGFFGVLPPERAKEALPFLLMNGEFLPPWLSGLAAAGILAAILSTVAPVMFAVSTIIVKDFYHNVINPDADDKTLLKTSRRMTVAVGLAVIPMAIFIRGGILDIAYLTYGIRGAAAVVVLAGVYITHKKTGKPIITAQAANAAFISSTLGIILYVLFKPQIVQAIGLNVDKVYVALFFSVLSLIVGTWLTKNKGVTSEPVSGRC
ncbi:MAG TPA: sodium:solute symporter family protein [Firmicutes bacterium]|nr:sodium:solute symporter family protein [Bacillota bacterium]